MVDYNKKAVDQAQKNLMETLNLKGDISENLANIQVRGQIKAAKQNKLGEIGAAQAAAKGQIGAARETAWGNVQAAAQDRLAQQYVSDNQLAASLYNADATVKVADTQGKWGARIAMIEGMNQDLSSILDASAQVNSAFQGRLGQKEASFNQYLSTLANADRQTAQEFIRGGYGNIQAQTTGAAQERASNYSADRSLDQTLAQLSRYDPSVDVASLQNIGAIVRGNVTNATNARNTVDNLFQGAIGAQGGVMQAALGGEAQKFAALAAERGNNLSSNASVLNSAIAANARLGESLLAGEAQKNVAQSQERSNALNSINSMTTALLAQNSNEAATRIQADSALAQAEKNRFANMYRANTDMASSYRQAAASEFGNEITATSNLAANTNTTEAQKMNSTLQAAMQLATNASNERIAETRAAAEIASSAFNNNASGVNNPYAQGIAGMLSNNRSNNNFSFTGQYI